MTSAQLDSICAVCKRRSPIEIAQGISNGSLTWFERFACECGHGFESSGPGLPTPGLRKALLEQLGSAKTWVDSAKSKPLAARALALMTGVEPAKASALLKKLPALVYTGTRVEADFVAQALKRAGAKARVTAVKKKK